MVQQSFDGLCLSGDIKQRTDGKTSHFYMSYYLENGRKHEIHP